MVGDREALGSAVVHDQRQSCRSLRIQRYEGISWSKRLATHSHKTGESWELLLPSSDFYSITVSKGRFKSHSLHIYIRKALSTRRARAWYLYCREIPLYMLIVFSQGYCFIMVHRLSSHRNLIHAQEGPWFWGIDGGKGRNLKLEWRTFVIETF